MIEFIISEDDLEELSGTVLSSLYGNFNSEFEKEDYLMERFTREDELNQIFSQSDDVKINTVSGYEKYITDLGVGYFAGKPNTYFNKNNKNQRIVTTKKLDGSISYKLEKIDSSKEESDDEFLDYILGVYEYNNEPKENKDLTYKAFITSRAYEMIYTDEKAKIRFSIINDKCFPFKKNDISKEIIGFTRKIEYEEIEENGNTINITEIELYTKNKRVFYSSKDNYTKEHELPSNGSFVKGEWEIPIVELTMDFGIGLFEQQVPDIRSYELVTNNTKSIEDYNDNAILKISNVDTNAYDDSGEGTLGTDEIVTKIKSSGVIFTDSESGVDADWLIKNTNDASTQNHKDNLKNDIFNTSGLFNPETDTQVYQNTLSLQFKLYKLETKMSAFQMEFEKFIKRRNKIICEIVNTNANKDYEYNQIGILFNRNLPTNTGEEINLANQLKDILPLKEIYRRLSFVDNAEKMYEEWKNEQLDLARLEAEKEKIYNEVTMEDMYTDSMQEFDDTVDDTTDNQDMVEDGVDDVDLEQDNVDEE